MSLIQENKDENKPQNNNNEPTGKEILDIKNYIPNKDPEKIVDIREPEIWSCFPFSERFWYSFCCKTRCCSDNKNGQFFIDECLKSECTRDKTIQISNKILGINILKSGTLSIEPMIIHPFVKISIVNLRTGRYIQKSNFKEPSVSRYESNFIIQHNKIQSRLDFQSSVLDCIPPVSTCPYDLREKGESFAEWNEEFYINEDAAVILDSNNIIFFELMDFNLNYSLNKINECVIPIAWGYLKPVGFSRTYMGKHKIQLYNYKFNRSQQLHDLKNKNREYLRTPDVLYELDWIKKTKYQTFLQIELTLNNKPTLEDIKTAFYYNKYINSVFVPEGDNIDKDLLKYQKKKKVLTDEEISYQKKLKLLKWKRLPNEPCRLPNRLLYKFPTAKLGCLTHEFSRDGKYLAAACTEISSETTIKIFNVEEGVLRYHLRGHHQIIHHLQWSLDNLILISVSADNKVTLWRVPKDDGNDMENLEFLDNESKFKLATLFHPAYVYSCDIFPDTTRKDLMILATACFDGNIRIYSISFNYDAENFNYNLIKATMVSEFQVSEGLNDRDYFKKVNEELKNKKIESRDKEKMILLDKTALDHRHPNTVVFDQNGQMYIGDSLGYIHIWEVRIVNNQLTINRIRMITHDELEHDTINKITLVPNQSKRLLVHSRDNCIRLLDLSTEKPKVVIRYFGAKCNKTNIKSTISPEASYILSGSEEGKPHLWQMETGIPIGTDKYECGFVDSINDVSWSNTFNMFALSAFGQEHPLLVYVYEKEDSEVQIKKKRKGKKNKENLKEMFGETPGGDDDNIDELIGDEKDGGIPEPEGKYLNPMQDPSSKFAKEYSTLIEKDVENK